MNLNLFIQIVYLVQTVKHMRTNAHIKVHLFIYLHFLYKKTKQNTKQKEASCLTKTITTGSFQNEILIICFILVTKDVSE